LSILQRNKERVLALWKYQQTRKYLIWFKVLVRYAWSAYNECTTSKKIWYVVSRTGGAVPQKLIHCSHMNHMSQED
jgi:hypothetical protein